jgi:L-asparaginase
MPTYTNKKVLVIFTGGTIAGNVAKSDVSQNVKSDPNSFMAILNASTDIIKKNWNIEINPEIAELINVDSSDMQPENWTMIIEEIQKRYDDFDSFIILHGTNTMGYTAAALTFALENINKPVILTGAQVPLGFLGTDSTTNLVNALRMAVWQYHDVKGVMAVFGSKIIAGSRVKKGTDFDYDPFNSFQTGSLGQIGRFMRINDNRPSKIR